jgi:DNA repair protein RecO (recombination protein O)
MPLLKTPAISLKGRKWGEADRIVTFYTLRFGKLRGVARGARRSKARFGAALEPFVHTDLNLFEKRGDSLYRITQADIRDPFARLREDLGLMAAAGRLANLVEAVTGEGDAGTKIFDTLLEGLHALQVSTDPALTALLFQIRLLGLTGFRPQTDHCAACGESAEDGRAFVSGHFSPASGGLLCAACAGRQRNSCLPLSPGSLAFMQHAIQWKPAVLTRLKAEGRVRAEAEAAVESYVTVVTGKRLPPVDFLVAEPSPASQF